MACIRYTRMSLIQWLSLILWWMGCWADVYLHSLRQPHHNDEAVQSKFMLMQYLQIILPIHNNSYRERYVILKMYILLWEFHAKLISSYLLSIFAHLLWNKRVCVFFSFLWWGNIAFLFESVFELILRFCLHFVHNSFIFFASPSLCPSSAFSLLCVPIRPRLPTSPLNFLLVPQFNRHLPQIVSSSFPSSSPSTWPPDNNEKHQRIQFEW